MTKADNFDSLLSFFITTIEVKSMSSDTSVIIGVSSHTVSHYTTGLKQQTDFIKRNMTGYRREAKLRAYTTRQPVARNVNFKDISSS